MIVFLESSPGWWSDAEKKIPIRNRVFVLIWPDSIMNLAYFLAILAVWVFSYERLAPSITS